MSKEALKKYTKAEAKIYDELGYLHDEVLEFEEIIEENQRKIKVLNQYINRRYKKLQKMKEDA